MINLPQQDMEPVLARALDSSGLSSIRFRHRFTGLEQLDDRVGSISTRRTAARHSRRRYLLACDGGRSAVRDALGQTVVGTSTAERYVLVDLACDLDVGNRRDYPYLAYFSDAKEWMILVRHPHCWRFLYPLPPEPSRRPRTCATRRCRSSARSTTSASCRRALSHAPPGRRPLADRPRVPDGRRGASDHADVGAGPQHRRAGRVQPAVAAGLGAAWLGDDALLDGYEREQRPLAIHGSGEMAEAARASMAKTQGAATAMTSNNWSNAYTRGMLGIRLDVQGRGAWSMVKTSTEPPVEPGDRIPDVLVHTPEGREVRLHDLAGDRFLALYFTDVRRRPAIPAKRSPALAHFAVSRWDAPFDSGVRDRALLDPGDRLKRRLGVADDTLVLVRPDEHIAAILPMKGADAADLYGAIVGKPVPE